MTARSKARKRALDVLYESELRGTDATETLAERSAQADPPIGAYAASIIQGVEANRARIDELIDTYAEGWDLNRMPAVDRNVLRIGVFELLGCDDVPDAVAVDEAVALAASLSTDDSPRFVNGILSRLLEIHPSLAPTETASRASDGGLRVAPDDTPGE